MAKTIGTDMFMADPFLSQNVLKWSVWRNSNSRIKPRSGLAQPSLSTWTHWRSMLESLILGRDKASPFFKFLRGLSTRSSTSFPSSGSINLEETWSLHLFRPEGIETKTLKVGAKWIFRNLVIEWVGSYGVLMKRAAMEAIQGYLQTSCVRVYNVAS